MYDRFLSMLNSQECMIILSVVLFLIYYLIKNEKNTKLNKMIILTIIVMSSNISKELTILLCILFIYLTFNRKKNIENFNVQSNNNLVINTNEDWNKEGVQNHISNSDDHFIGKVDKMFIKGRPEKTENGQIIESQINGWKDGVCSSEINKDFFSNAAAAFGITNNSVKNRCTNFLRDSNGVMSKSQVVENLSNEELEVELLKVSDCAKKINSDGYDDEAFAACAAATGKHFRPKCKVSNNITVNGNTVNYCYPNSNMETSTAVANITDEDKVLIRDKLMNGELLSQNEYLPIKKYKLDSTDTNELKVLLDNSDETSHEEFVHYNLEQIKQSYLTEPSGMSGSRIESDIPITGFNVDSGSGSVNNGFYYYKANNVASRDSLNEPIIISELNSSVRKHLLNNGYMYKYEFDVSNDPMITVMNGNARWLPDELNGKVNFDINFDYRRIAVYIDNTDETDNDLQPAIRLNNKVFLGYLGQNFTESVNIKVLNSEPVPNNGTDSETINWLTFFDVVNQNVVMVSPETTNGYHPKFQGQSMEMIEEEIREEVYIKYNPFDASLIPGTSEHMIYTNNYFNQKNNWEDRTSKYIMRSIGCNRLRDPKIHSFGWWGKEINLEGEEIWKCKYENKSDITLNPQINN